jgi:hypothetical protein
MFAIDQVPFVVAQHASQHVGMGRFSTAISADMMVGQLRMNWN